MFYSTVYQVLLEVVHKIMKLKFVIKNLVMVASRSSLVVKLAVNIRNACNYAIKYIWEAQ